MPSTLSDGDEHALVDIRHNIALAVQFVGDLSLDEFAADNLRFYAVTRALEIISEASRRLSEAVRDRHPGLPWRAIRDSGNHYRHSYENVAEARVWRTVHEDLPLLRAAIEHELGTGPS